MLFARETLQKNKKFTSYLRLDVILKTATTKNWNKFLPVVVEVPYLNRRTATNQALDDRRIRLPSLRYRCPIVLKKWPQERCCRRFNLFMQFPSNLWNASFQHRRNRTLNIFPSLRFVSPH